MMTEQTTLFPDQKDVLHDDVKDAPGFDLDGFLESRKLDIYSVTRATSAAFAGARTIVEKQADLLKTVLTEVGEALRALPQEAPKPAELIRKRQELPSEALSNALTSLKEIADSVGKTQAEILEIVSTRVRSNVEEIRRFVRPPQPDGAK